MSHSNSNSSTNEHQIQEYHSTRQGSANSLPTLALAIQKAPMQPMLHIAEVPAPYPQSQAHLPAMCQSLGRTPSEAQPPVTRAGKPALTHMIPMEWEARNGSASTLPSAPMHCNHDHLPSMKLQEAWKPPVNHPQEGHLLQHCRPSLAQMQHQPKCQWVWGDRSTSQSSGGWQSLPLPGNCSLPRTFCHCSLKPSHRPTSLRLGSAFVHSFFSKLAAHFVRWRSLWRIAHSNCQSFSHPSRSSCTQVLLSPTAPLDTTILLFQHLADGRWSRPQTFEGVRCQRTVATCYHMAQRTPIELLVSKCCRPCCSAVCPSMAVLSTTKLCI